METSNNTNVGIDFALLSNRLRGTVEFFNRDSKNPLRDVPISQDEINANPAIADQQNPGY